MGGDGIFEALRQGRLLLREVVSESKAPEGRKTSGDSLVVIIVKGLGKSQLELIEKGNGRRGRIWKRSGVGGFLVKLASIGCE